MAQKPGRMNRPTDVLQIQVENRVFVVEQRNHRISRWQYSTNNFDFTLSAGQVSDPPIQDDTGSNYVTAPIVVFSPPDLDIAEPILATGTANLVGDGIETITLTNPGLGYSVPPTITFLNEGTGGSGAMFTAFLTNSWGSNNGDGTSGIPGTTTTDDDDHFNFPTGIIFFNNVLYVPDTLNHRIRTINADTGAFVDSIGGPGTQGGSGDIQFYRPTFIGHNPDEGIFVVTDSRNSRIVVFDDSASHNFIGFSDGTFHTPSGTQVPFEEDFIYYSDSVRSVVEQYDDDGITFLQTFGSPGTDPAIPSQLFYPGNGHGDNNVDPDFDPIISDTRNNTIKTFDSGGNITNFGNLTAGTQDGKLYFPSSVSGISDGTAFYVLVANTLNNRIEAFSDLGGTFTFETTIGAP